MEGFLEILNIELNTRTADLLYTFSFKSFQSLDGESAPIYAWLAVNAYPILYYFTLGIFGMFIRKPSYLTNKNTKGLRLAAIASLVLMPLIVTASVGSQDVQTHEYSPYFALGYGAIYIALLCVFAFQSFKIWEAFINYGKGKGFKTLTVCYGLLLGFFLV